MTSAFVSMLCAGVVPSVGFVAAWNLFRSVVSWTH